MAPFPIRIPDEMDDRIKQAASEDNRSKNGEIKWLLRLRTRPPTERAGPAGPRLGRHKDGNPRNSSSPTLAADPPEENKR